MQRLPIIIGLHCENESYPYEAAAFVWATHLQTALESQSIWADVPIHLEGVGALCDHYLRIHPEERVAVRNRAAAAKLWTGLWYAPPCELLASGESLIRNLLIGSALAKALGMHTHTCFLPPSPLHLLQLPQILAGFGIRAVAVPLQDSWPLTRSEYRVYQWGTEHTGSVTLIPLPVCSIEHLVQATEGDAAQLPSGALLCSVSGHLERFGALLKQNQDVLQPLLIERLTVQVEAIQADSLQGELIQDLTSHQEAEQRETPNLNSDHLPAASDASVRPSYVRPWQAGDPAMHSVSFISAWPQLRRAVRTAQERLERWAEPWAAAAWLMGHSYPERFLAEAWRLLLMNQVYDGVCGSLDNTTYRHMLAQTERAQQLADVIFRQALNAIVQVQPEEAASVKQGDTAAAQRASFHPAASYLWVANPLGWQRDEIIYADVFMPADTQHLQLTSPDGDAIPYQVFRSHPSAVQTVGGSLKRRFTIAFRSGPIPAAGFSRFLVQPVAHKPFFLGESIAAGHTLENKYLRVVVKTNGALRIEDKRTGYVYDNCNVFEDGGDCGSTTAYVAPEQDRLITTYAGHAHSQIVENGVLVGTIQVRHELEAPAALHPLRDHRAEQQAVCEIVSYVTLKEGADRIEIHTQVRNNVRDHRLRVLFSTDIASADYHVSQPFAVVERPALNGAERQTLPKQEFVDISDANHGLLVVSRGLYEYEIKPTPAGTIALTLFRAVGASDDTASESQTPNLLQFSYALIPHAGNWENALAGAGEFCAPLRAFTNQDIRLDPAAVQPEQTGYGLVALEPLPLLLSAIKRSEDGRALIVRAYNPTARTITGILTCRLPIHAACLATLAEEPHTPLTPHDEHSVSLTFGPRQIITVRLERTPGSPFA